MVTKAISGLGRYMCFDPLRTLLRRPDFQIRKSTAEKNAMNDIYNYWLYTDYELESWSKKSDRMYEVPVVAALLEKTFDEIPDSLAPRVLWPFVYYAFAGYPSRTADTDAESGQDLDADHGSDSVSLTQSSIPESTAPDVYGVSVWDNSSGDLRRGLRNKLEVEGISFSSLDSKGRSFLHNVCMLGSDAIMNIDCVQFLLKNGAEPNLRDETGRTPLHYAAASKEEVAPKIVRALISAGADPRASDNDGRTVLHSAASGKSLEVLELLVERGADINAITISGDSVLYVVAENAESPRPMIEYLLAKGCRLDVKNNNHMTPGFASFWRSPETLETFLDLGEDPFAQNSFGNSMFLNCVWMFEPKRTSLCLSHRPSEGDTPLHRVGYFGMNAFDFLSNFDRSVATELGFTTHDWLAYTPTPPTVRREHVLKFLLLRIVEMLAPDVDRRRFLSRRGAHQLLHLGDDHGATILLEKFLVPASRGSASPYFERTIHCSTCRSNDAPIFKCRICASVYFCGECRDVIPRKRGSYIESTHCKGHRFLEIPGENWRNLPDGKVNPEGQTMEEFLEGLKDRVMRELGSSACSGQGLLTKSDILEDSASY
jgi:ankyrin repeat protein